MVTIELGVLLLAGLNTIAIPWAIWVTRSMYDLKEKIAVNNGNDATLKKAFDIFSTKLDIIVEDLNDLKVLLAANGIKK